MFRMNGSFHRSFVLTWPPLAAPSSMEEMAKVTALIDSQQKRHKRHPIHKRKGSDRLDGDQQLLALKDLYEREGDSGQ